MNDLEDVEHGWFVVRLASEKLIATVVPGKGGDVVSLLSVPSSTELLFQSPWGLRPPVSTSAPGSSEALLMEAYSGGWQTVFPNAGNESYEHGVQWGMHGEVWHSPFEVIGRTNHDVVMQANLVRSPFVVTKRVDVIDNTITVHETVLNNGRTPVDVMWGQHPAFGEPLIAAGTRVSSPGCNVAGSTVGNTIDTSSTWPASKSTHGKDVELDRTPGAGAGYTVLAYLDEHRIPEIRIENDELGLALELQWSPETYPYLWYWMEAGGVEGFPWFGRAHVLAIEPNSSWPATGVSAVRESTATHLTFEPGEERHGFVSVSVSDT